LKYGKESYDRISLMSIKNNLENLKVTKI